MSEETDKQELLSSRKSKTVALLLLYRKLRCISYKKSATRGSHCGGKEICRFATRRRRRILQCRILFSCGIPWFCLKRYFPFPCPGTDSIISACNNFVRNLDAPEFFKGSNSVISFLENNLSYSNHYCSPITKTTSETTAIAVHPKYLPAISSSDGSARSALRMRNSMCK